MFVENISWSPVRLEIKRLGSGQYELLRDGATMGVVSAQGVGRWRCGKSDSEHPSFRAAALRACRYSGLWTNTQDLGTWVVRRIEVGGIWYTFMKRLEAPAEVCVFEDFPKRLEAPSGEGQTRLRKAIALFEGRSQG